MIPFRARRFLLFVCAFSLFAMVLVSSAPGQVLLPSGTGATGTIVAGGASANPTSGSACATGSIYTATDSYGDGCPATLALLGTTLYGNAVDSAGNIYLLDTGNKVIHKIDARSGLMTRVAGLASTPGCGTQTTSVGDGCLAATQTGGFNPRGMAMDPYDNILIADYGDSLVHIICNTVSPLCSSAQIGYMRLIAGAVASTTSIGTATSGNTPGSAGDGNTAISTSGTGVNQPRGVAADKWGNVYIADTANIRFRVVVGPSTSTYAGANPLAGVIALDSAYSSITASSAAGKIYPIYEGFTAVAAGNYCSGSSGPKSLSANGDGCPFYNTGGNSTSTSSTLGVAVDAAGDVIFSDAANKLIHVLYMGGTAMGAAIVANNKGNTNWVSQATNLNVGSVYLIAGNSSGSGISSTATLGTSTNVGQSSIYRFAVDAAGDIYMGDQGPFVSFFDVNTGYIRQILVGTTTTPAFAANSSTLPIAVDSQNNIYVNDSTNKRIIRFSGASLNATTVGTSASQSIVVHEPAGVTSATAVLATSSPDITVGTVSCASVADTTRDCTVPLTILSTAPGYRTASLVVTPAGSSTTPKVFPLNTLATGSAIVSDNGTNGTTAIANTSNLAALHALSVAVDGANNVYAADATTFNVYIPGQGGTTLASLTPPTGVTQIAVDAGGNIYAVGSGAATIQKLSVSAAQASSAVPPTYTSSTISYTPPTTPAIPQGVAVDNAGNIYVSDKANGAVYRINPNSTLNGFVTIATGFSNPTVLALDNADNLYVADPGATAVYKIALGSNTQTTFQNSITATGLATDAAGDVYIQTATGVKEYTVQTEAAAVQSYPATGAAQTIYTGGTTPTGLAADGKGNLYMADSGAANVVELTRSTLAYSFPDTSTIVTSALTNAGNQAATGFAQTDSGEFVFAAGASNGCTVTGATPIGAECTVKAQFSSGSGNGLVTNTVTFTPTSTVGNQAYSGTKTGSAATTTTTISGQTPTNPTFVSSGTTVTFTVTVAASSGTATGSVAVTLDSGTAVNYSLNGSGVATVALSGVTAGSHTLAASYSSQNGFGSSTATSVNFSVAQITTTITWSPSVTTQSVSQAIGTGVLDATVGSVAGTYTYTATPTGGSASAIDASTYLTIGTYSLAVTFTPTDATDYTTATGSVASYSVTKANTTAPIGATQFLVSNSGTGNYSSLTAALQALPVTGGAIYLAPGTYTGQNAISYPNVSLRGLGGNAAAVILTASNGAFSAGSVYPGYSLGPAGHGGDEGSATLDVGKFAFIGQQATSGSVTYTPAGFYAENLTIQNTFNTDNVTTTTANTVVANGTCTAGQTAQTLQYLYNNQLECNSQALALSITADQAVLNNVNLTSQQDTLYAAGNASSSCSTCLIARQYYWKGTITGDVDYIFGDAAAVFDHDIIFTTWHGTTSTGTETIEAQQKLVAYGASNDYLSGYIFNGTTFYSQSTNMTNLYFGRPYGTYSTAILLNTSVDQVNALGFLEFSGKTNLPTSTYGEYNTSALTDPTPGTGGYPATLPGGVTPTGSNTGTNATAIGSRETTSIRPYALTAAQAAAYLPVTYLGTTVSSSAIPSGAPTSWNPVTALATNMNAFVPSSTTASVNAGGSITLLMRPQTPGGGILPTGTYTLTDNGTTTLASGSLDASGEAYYTTTSLSAGSHSITWTYGGDSNFNGSSTSTPLVITVNSGPVNTTTAVSASASSANYGATVTATVTVAPTSGTGNPTGSVTLTIDGTTTQNTTLSSGTATFTLTGLGAGTHTFSASYAGDTNNNASSSTSSASVSLAKVALTVTASSSSRAYGQPNTLAYTITGFVGSDTQSSATTGAPSITTTATQTSAANTYTITAAVGTLAASNYTLSFVNGTLTVTATATQTIFFPKLPNFPIGTYLLTARTNSGQAVTYTVTTGSGLATVNSTTHLLTITGAGTIGITASAPAVGGYTAASSVTQTFTSH
jgi:hypothetical protein